MDRNEVLKRIKKDKLIAIVRGIDIDKIADTAKALSDGGIRCMEIAINQTNENTVKETIDSIKLLKNIFGDKIFLGAGTVLSANQANEAVAAGASYIISPNYNETVVRRAKELGTVSIPGAFTPTEAESAYRAGADIIKIFPAGNMGPAYIKALSGPLGHIPFMAVGGINKENISGFIKAGVCGCGIGGSLVSKEAVLNGMFDKITQSAEEYVKIVKNEV